jgi:hypothetical protein
MRREKDIFFFVQSENFQTGNYAMIDDIINE